MGFTAGSFIPVVGNALGALIGGVGGGLIGGFSSKAEGGKVPVMLSPGEQVIPPEELHDVADGKKNAFATGKRVPGKPKYPGNDYRNDVKPDKLPAGAVVIPNKIMQSGDHWAAMKFVRAHMAKGGKVGMIKHGLSSKKSKK
jgi:hypothetical protein